METIFGHVDFLGLTLQHTRIWHSRQVRFALLRDDVTHEHRLHINHTHTHARTHTVSIFRRGVGPPSQRRKKENQGPILERDPQKRSITSMRRENVIKKDNSRHSCVVLDGLIFESLHDYKLQIQCQQTPEFQGNCVC